MSKFLPQSHDLRLPIICSCESAELFQEHSHNEFAIALVSGADRVFISNVDIADLNLNVIDDLGHKLVYGRGILLYQTLCTLAEDFKLLKSALIGRLIGLDLHLFLPFSEELRTHQCE